MDNRNPPPINENVRKSMRSNKGKGTKPELIVRQMLRELGYPGYRLNWKKAPGHPDIAYPGRMACISCRCARRTGHERNQRYKRHKWYERQVRI